METMGRRLRMRRIELELTLQEIADRMRVSPMYVSDIERGKRVPLQPMRLAALAEAYELTRREIEQLAFASQDAIELDIAGDPMRREAAVALARAWPDMSVEQLQQLRQLAAKGEANGTD